MRNILLLIKGLGRGGAEQLLVSSAVYRDRSRFQYEVAYLLPEKDALVDELQAQDVPAICLGGARGTGWMRQLRSLVRSHGIDLVHSHQPFAAAGARISLSKSGPLHLSTEHNVWQRYHPATFWANALTFHRNQHVFAVSRHVEASIRYPSLISFKRMPRVETLYYGLDPAAVESWDLRDGVREEFGIPVGAPLIANVANFKRPKGHEFLLRAADVVRRSIPEVKFLLVGTGALEEEVHQLARALRLEDTVIFAGFRSDVPRLVAASDLFVLASLFEGLAIALVEAMALGKASVVTGVGGLLEVVEHGKEALIVPPANPGSLAEAIIKLLGDPQLRDRLGAAARERAAAFDIRNSVRRVEHVYSEVLS